MDFSGLMGSIVSFVQNNPIIAIVFVLAFLFFMYRKPKLFFTLFGVGVLLAGLLYLVMTMAGSGSEKKKALTHEEEQSDADR